MVIELNGQITEDGELKLELPSGLPSGEARITIEIPAETDKTSAAARTHSFKIEPLSGAEIIKAGLTGAWADEGITDSVAWVEEQRRKRRERHQW